MMAANVHRVTFLKKWLRQRSWGARARELLKLRKPAKRKQMNPHFLHCPHFPHCPRCRCYCRCCCVGRISCTRCTCMGSEVPVLLCCDAMHYYYGELVRICSSSMCRYASPTDCTYTNTVRSHSSNYVATVSWWFEDQRHMCCFLRVTHTDALCGQHSYAPADPAPLTDGRCPQPPMHTPPICKTDEPTSHFYALVFEAGFRSAA